MAPDPVVPVIAHAIQLAVAPVFLLTGIGTLLGVMAHRLARVVDRTRDLEERNEEMDEQTRATARVELGFLERRAHLASWSINFSTCAALLVCIVIATLFIEEYPVLWLAGILIKPQRHSFLKPPTLVLPRFREGTSTVHKLRSRAFAEITGKQPVVAYLVLFAELHHGHGADPLVHQLGIIGGRDISFRGDSPHTAPQCVVGSCAVSREAFAGLACAGV